MCLCAHRGACDNTHCRRFILRWLLSRSDHLRPLLPHLHVVLRHFVSPAHLVRRQHCFRFTPPPPRPPQDPPPPPSPPIPSLPPPRYPSGHFSRRPRANFTLSSSGGALVRWSVTASSLHEGSNAKRLILRAADGVICGAHADARLARERNRPDHSGVADVLIRRRSVPAAAFGASTRASRPSLPVRLFTS